MKVAPSDRERLYISGLDYSVGRSDLSQLLSERGIIPLKIDVPPRRGFGFVTVATRDTEPAMLMSGEIFRGRILKVERALFKNRGVKRGRSGILRASGAGENRTA